MNRWPDWLGIKNEKDRESVQEVIQYLEECYEHAPYAIYRHYLDVVICFVPWEMWTLSGNAEFLTKHEGIY